MGALNPADAIASPHLVARYMRKDDIVRDIVNVRAAQDRAVQDLGLKAPPTLPRLREANETRDSFAELFRDLELTQPPARTDGNATAERLAHVEQLQRFGAEAWRRVDLLRLASSDSHAFDNAETEIVREAKCVAADPRQGSFRRPGALRPTIRTDNAGHKVTTWHGDPNAWMNRFHDPLIRCLNAVGDGYGNWYPL
jgi:hypothetical protein